MSGQLSSRQARMQQSAHYRHKVFHNLSYTPMLADGVSFPKVLVHALLKPGNTRPPSRLPAVKQPLAERCMNFTLTWFGHASYLIQVLNRNILVDPVFGKRPSFSTFLGPVAFAGSRAYHVEDLPPIDTVVLTHDHYDHLEYPTIRRLKDRVQTWYMPLGVGAYLESWGIAGGRIQELDWWETTDLGDDLRLTATPARHFSGRGFARNRTLWASYVLQAGRQRIFLGGDSGYDTHFRDIGSQFGPFDLALLECGQYDAYWPFIHMLPEQTVQAAEDLGARWLMPVHWGAFSLSVHAWDEPVKRLLRAAEGKPVNVTTPMIGEPLVLDTHMPKHRWWEQL